jgi:hypothetical protein
LTVLDLMDERIAELDQLVRNKRREADRYSGDGEATTLEILRSKLDELRYRKRALARDVGLSKL